MRTAAWSPSTSGSSPARTGSPKDCVWQLPDGRKGLNGRKVHTLPLYSAVPELARGATGRVVIVEGEKACDALTGRGEVAFGTVTGDRRQLFLPVDDN
jgi:hypothetical protein